MNRGFTLTEMLVGMLISSILLLTVGLMATAGTNSYNKQRNIAEIYNNVTSGVDFLESNIRKATVVSWNSGAKTLTGSWVNGSTYNFVIRSTNGNLTYSDTLYGAMTAPIMRNVTAFSVSNAGNLYNVTININASLGNKAYLNFTRTLSVAGRNL
jgi:prepilin-type N-terminal cleavage/methylation domain-containing protein